MNNSIQNKIDLLYEGMWFELRIIINEKLGRTVLTQLFLQPDRRIINTMRNLSEREIYAILMYMKEESTPL